MSVEWRTLEHMIDKLSQALTLMREAFADAQTGSMFMPSVDLAAEVDAAQKVINAASAVQALRVAQYAAREQEQDATGAWVDVDHGVGHVGEFAADCFGPMLAMGPVAAGRKVETAAILASRLPATLAAMSAGDLDWWRATIIATELSEASGQSCAASGGPDPPGRVVRGTRCGHQKGPPGPGRGRRGRGAGSRPPRNAWTGSSTPTPPTCPA